MSARNESSLLKVAERLLERTAQQVVDLGSYGQFDPSSNTPPAIEDFARSDTQPASADIPRTYSAEVQFEGDVPDSEIMDYIMGIESKLGISVTGFDWAVKEGKTAADHSAQLMKIATNLSKYSSGQSEVLTKLAQEMMSDDLSQQSQEFDPSSEPPAIESFVKRKDTPTPSGPKQIHTAQIQFTGDVKKKSEVMQYITGIKNQLPVRVTGFSWRMKEDKASRTV